MATYNFLDYEGLESLLKSIDAYYASKAALEEQEISLQGTISSLDTTLKDLINQVQNDLETSLSQETTSRESADNNFEASITSLTTALQEVTDDLTTEITDRKTAVQGLSTEVDSKLEKLRATLTTSLRGYIDQKIADLVAEGIKDIIVLKPNESLPNPGAESFLYITPDHAIHQWVGISEKYPDGWKTLGEDTAAEIATLTNQISNINDNIDDLNDRVDNTVDTDTYNSFIEAYNIKTAEFDQSILNLDESVANLESTVPGLETDIESLSISIEDLEQTTSDLSEVLDSKLSGIIVNGTPATVEDGIATITIQGGGGGEGTDPELRRDFEAFKELTSGQINNIDTELSEHIDANNPHNITKESVGLGQVDNTSDIDKPISNAVREALETKVSSEDFNVALENKVSIEDITDNLISPYTDRPLSANQGIVLSEMIDDVKTQVTSIGAAVIFKGTVSSYADLPDDPNQGDCYQIYNEEDPQHGEMYAYSEASWVKIVASAQDMSSLIASQADINKIISDYR